MTPFLSAEELPIDPTTGNPLIQSILKREGNAVWRIRAEPLRPQPDGPLAWTLVRDGELVRIPMLPYRSKQDPVRTLLAGMDVIQRYVDTNADAVRTHIIVGAPIEELRDEFRFWVGFAAQLR